MDIPEIMDRNNVAHFINPDIKENSTPSSKEERLQAEGFNDGEEDMHGPYLATEIILIPFLFNHGSALMMKAKPSPCNTPSPKKITSQSVNK